MMNSVEKEIKKLKIEQNIKNLLFLKKAKKGSIQWGMNYITFSPSKRLRPLLLLESNLVFSSLDKDAYVLSAAIELIHTYSLVHDDLPCMDDDNLRRGVKTLHTIKSEAYALLVGDALLTRSFGILSMYSKNKFLPKILESFLKKAGHLGMILGQIMDIEAENKTIKPKKMDEINKYKTGSLFELCLFLGALNGNAKEKDLIHMEKLGTLIGYIFQLKDDILDIIGDDVVLGKTVGSDEKNKKSSIPLAIGVSKAEELMCKYKHMAFKNIDKLPSNKDFFYKLIDYIIKREK